MLKQVSPEETLVILDWNGTMQDDLHHIYECGVQRIFRHYGLPCPTVDEYRHEVTSNFMESFYWPRGISRDVTAADLNAIMAEGFKEKGTPPGLFPDAKEFVEILAQHGYVMAIASGYAQAKLDAAVERSGLKHHFLSVVGDVRDKTEAFTSLIDHAAVDGSCAIVVGDTEDDVLGAVGVGAWPLICTRGFHPVERLEALRAKAPNLVLADALMKLLGHVVHLSVPDFS